MADTSRTVHQLRSQWKTHKLRLSGINKEHPTPVRFHRACSWLLRIEQMNDDSDLDLDLSCRWIAFNALYGVWDEARREPRPDRDSWRKFLSRILNLDCDSIITDMLQTNRNLVMSLLKDEYLSLYFWEDPTDKRASQSKKAMYNARTWYQQEQWSLILENALERIYLMRCQLIHGAATYNSGKNRTSLKRCAMMLEHVLVSTMRVLIEQGADEDWGPLCYPPMN